MAQQLEEITSVIIIETAAAHEAALFLQTWTDQNVTLEGDALLVIVAVQNNLEVNYGPLGRILTDIRTL